MLFSLIGWAGSLLLVYSLWLVGNKKRYSFLLTMLSEVLILVQSVHLKNWPIISGARRAAKVTALTTT